ELAAVAAVDVGRRDGASLAAASLRRIAVATGPQLEVRTVGSAPARGFAGGVVAQGGVEGGDVTGTEALAHHVTDLPADATTEDSGEDLVLATDRVADDGTGNGADLVAVATHGGTAGRKRDEHRKHGDEQGLTHGEVSLWEKRTRR